MKNLPPTEAPCFSSTMTVSPALSLRTHNVVPRCCHSERSEEPAFRRHHHRSLGPSSPHPLLCTRYSRLLNPLLPINLPRELRNKIQQRPPPHLLRRRPPAIRKRVLPTRLPRRSNHPSTKRSSIQRPLRTQMLLAAIISH